METVKFYNKGEQIDLELTDEFNASLDILNNTNRSLFITGKAGCGKSTLLNYFVSQTDKVAAVVAFTGLAAINVEGETIHSFFGFPLGFIDPPKVRFKPKLKYKLRALDVIIVDEVSMVRADLIDAMDKSLRIHRNSDMPFGGVQMVFIGDLYQLPPIVETGLEKVYSQYYRTPYFFSADVFEYYKLPYINLSKIHRQKDEKFIEILNSVRERKDLHKFLPELNKRISFDLNEIRKGETICITTTNEKANEINRYFLDKLKTQNFGYKAQVTGDFDKSSYPTNEKLVLKEGAKVMFIRNDTDVPRRFVNGDIGIITHLSKTKIVVKKGDQEISIKPQTWEKYKYKYCPPETEDDEKGHVEKQKIGSFVQIPLKLAWAITIHKSQGQTYNKVFIDLHWGTFTSGQSYVALSRCRSLEGVSLKRGVKDGDIILDERIEEFYETFDNIMI